MTEQTLLEQAIISYNELYRKGTSAISDSEYDILVDKLKEKFPHSELLKKGVVKQEVKESRKETLPLPMYSLNKCKSLKEVEQWLSSNNISKNEPLIITPKYDGISLVTEESSDLAWTRGDGEVGQRSHIHFAKMNDKHCGIDLFAFGEAIMPKRKFLKYKDKFANPRNMVAGLFNRDEAGEELRDVNYIRYGSSREDLHKIDQLNILNRINEVPVKFYVCDSEYLSDDLFTTLYEDWGKDYQIDGLVIEINDAVTRDRLGREENLNPKYARAIKLPEWSQEAIVKVKGVTWQVSKQGKLKPVIQIEPTELAGVIIENVTGYNAKYIFDNNIAIDSLIKIVRSGDVIPKHIETVSFDIKQVESLSDEISVCPSCGEPTKWDETMTELICTNSECKEKKIMKLVHFFSTLEVEEFGEPSIRTLFNYGWESYEDILNLKIDNLVVIDGFAFTSAHKLVSQFERLREVGVPLAKLLHACDVFEGKIGEKTCQLILDNIETDKLSHICTRVGIQELTNINGVSDITAQIFLVGYRRFFNLTTGVHISNFTTPKQEVIGDKFSGMKICFTGCRPTKEQEQEIKRQGGEIVSGVTKKTTHLVIKDTTSSSSKTQSAKSLGVEIITIKELWK